MKEYDYFVHPLTDGVAGITSELLEEALEALRQLLPPRFDRFLCPEAMGLPLAAGLTMRTGHAFVVARKRPYGLPGESAVTYATGYAQGHYYLNGIQPGERLVLVDDVVSRGGTIRAIAQGIRRSGAELVKVVVLFNKDHDLDRLAHDIGCPVEAVVRLRIGDGAVEVLS